MGEEFLTPDEVAAILKISKYTVYEKVKKGELPATRIGRRMRIKKSDLDIFASAEIPEIANTSSDFRTSVSAPIRFFGSHDLSIEILAKLLTEKTGDQVHATYIGSMEGLMQLYFGQADVVGCHLFDEESGKYNLPFVTRIIPNEDVHVISFVKRNIGWIVPKGNPNHLRSWQDLKRKDLTFINRQKGSGTRILFDYNIKKMEIEKDAVAGYETIEHTHVGAASHVLRGEADAALGTESAANNLGLGFVLLEKESYDFVVTDRFFKSFQGGKFLEFLKTPLLKEEIERLGGYDCSRMGFHV